MPINMDIVEDTFAEAFRMWAARLIVTAIDDHWVRVAAGVTCGYGTSVIGCDAEAGIERFLSEDETPDGRPGVALLFFGFKAENLRKAVPNRVAQCLMTCPTTAVYDGLPDLEPSDDTARIDLGKRLRFFGDGHQKSKVVVIGPHEGAPNADLETHRPSARRLWRIPVMDGEFTCEETVGVMKAIGGGNFLICGRDQRTTLEVTRAATDVLAQMNNVITPFPGGIVRSGSKVGSRYKGMFASTNDAYCPTLRGQVKSALRPGMNCVYEVVINGLSETHIAAAMALGITTAAEHAQTMNTDIVISAGNYGGKLGKFHFKLREVLA